MNTFSGDLDVLSAEDALQFLQLRRRSGTLTLTGEVTYRLSLRGGRIVHAEGPQGLGEVLVEAGAIDPAALSQALHRQSGERPRPALGEVLVAAGALPAARLRELLRGVVHQAVSEVCGWTRSTFEFVPDERRVHDELDLGIDPREAVLEAARRRDEAGADAALVRSAAARATRAG